MTIVGSGTAGETYGISITYKACCTRRGAQCRRVSVRRAVKASSSNRSADSRGVLAGAAVYTGAYSLSSRSCEVLAGRAVGACSSYRSAQSLRVLAGDAVYTGAYFCSSSAYQVLAGAAGSARSSVRSPRRCRVLAGRAFCACCASCSFLKLTRNARRTRLSVATRHAWITSTVGEQRRAPRRVRKRRTTLARRAACL